MGFGQPEAKGFSRLTTDEFRQNPREFLRRILVDGDRFVLQQAEQDVAAIISVGEFEQLDRLWEEIAPSPYSPEEEEYYAYERGIHCIDLDELQDCFDDILEEVRVEGELFGLRPPPNLGEQDIDIFMPVAIFMNMGMFWMLEPITVSTNFESKA
jgi:hypothetical protein